MVSAVRQGVWAIVTVVVLVVLGVGVALAVGDARVGGPIGSVRAEGALPSWTAAEIAERDALMAWLARGLLALAFAWVLIGILAARTPLVRRPGAAAARATWLASTRPWRARESTLGMLGLDHWLLLLVPIALLIGTRMIQTSFRSWGYLAVVLGGWTAFALVLRWLLGLRRSPFPVIAAVGGVVVLRCILALIVLAFAGPGGSLYDVPAESPVRVVYAALAFALFVWVFIAAIGAMRVQIGRRRAIGAVLGAIGAGLAVSSLVLAVIGVDAAVREWEAQIMRGVAIDRALLDDAVWPAFAVGSALFVLGFLLATRWRTGVATRTDSYVI